MLLVLFLLLQLRIRLVAVYQESGPLLRVDVGPFWFFVYPRPEKTERALRREAKRMRRRQMKAEKKAGKKPQKQAAEQPLKGGLQSLGGTLALLEELLPVVLEAAGRFRRKLLIKELVLRLTWGARDPADAAIGYGRANAILGAVLAALEASFRVKKTDTMIELDFELEKPEIYLSATVSLSLMQAMSLGFFAAGKALGVYRAHRKRKKTQENTTTRKAVQ